MYFCSNGHLLFLDGSCLPACLTNAQQGSKWGNCLILLFQQRLSLQWLSMAENTKRQIISTGKSYCSSGPRRRTTAAYIPLPIPKLYPSKQTTTKKPRKTNILKKQNKTKDLNRKLISKAQKLTQNSGLTAHPNSVLCT